MRPESEARIGGWTVRRLGAGDVAQARALLSVFTEAFAEATTPPGPPPSESYLIDALGRPEIAVMAALRDGAVVGGSVAYRLIKLEQERSEIYLYELAVAEAHRRRGAALALIEAVRRWGVEQGAWVVFVQADYVDPPAIALYTRLGRREDVLHFDIRTDQPVVPAWRDRP